MRDKLKFIADPGEGRDACAVDQSIDYVGDRHVNHPWLPTHPWVTQHNTSCYTSDRDRLSLEVTCSLKFG